MSDIPSMPMEDWKVEAYGEVINPPVDQEEKDEKE